MSNSFWDVVEQVKQASGANWESRPANLKAALLTLSAQDIIQFNSEYRQKLSEAYRWDLWGAAYLINGGCSDDSFDYWCDFLISEGLSVYQSVLDKPDNLAELDDIEGVDLEGYRYAIDEAYEELTGKQMPQIDVMRSSEPEGVEWDEDELPTMFPKLAEKYG